MCSGGAASGATEQSDTRQPQHVRTGEMARGSQRRQRERYQASQTAVQRTCRHACRAATPSRRAATAGSGPAAGTHLFLGWKSLNSKDKSGTGAVNAFKNYYT